MAMASLFFLIALFAFQPNPQDSLSLHYVHEQIETNYPLAEKIDLQDDITELNRKIAITASYPQLQFGAQASYQSEVTDLPFPAQTELTAPELSKDQYRATVETNQLIYNGGAVAIRQELEEARGENMNQSTKVALHKIKEQANQVYFGILIAKNQQKINTALMEKLKARIKEVSSQVEHGVLLPSQQFTLEAELINARQDSVEIHSNIVSGYKVLSELIDEEINPDTDLAMPEINFAFRDATGHLRPEFDLFRTNQRVLNIQEKLAGTEQKPSLSAFGSAAYGRPGYNVFDNDLHAFYMVGLKLQWNFLDARNAAKKKQVLQLQQKAVNEDERAFERQLQADLGKIRDRISMLEDKLKRDQQIIDLRQKVVAEKASQLKNGAVTATEYLTELTKATQAQLSQMLNRIKLVQAEVDYQTTAGYSNK